MEALGSEASLGPNLSFSGIAELPPKKRTTERGKVVLDEPLSASNLRESSLSSYKLPSVTISRPENGQNLGIQDKGKALLDQGPSTVHLEPEIRAKQDGPEPSPNILLHPKEGAKGDSLKSPSFPPSRYPIVCKFCGQQFSTTQALGGHQNAHKQEREMQKAMKAAHEFGASSLLYHFPGARARAESYYGHQLQFHPYNRYGQTQRGWQPTPTYPHRSKGLSWGQPGPGRALEGFAGPYIRPSGPVKRYDGSIGASNFTNLLQAIQNKASDAKKKRMDLNLSLKCSGSAKLDIPSKCNESTQFPVKSGESTKLDLTLKL